MTALEGERSFERFAGTLSIAVGIGGIGYAVAFVILLRTAPKAAEYFSHLFLVVGGILTTAVAAAVYRRLQQANPAAALWGLLLSVA